ncbi:hypothetical protein M9H77_22475 [Catharanthus roseus]|uniref:Uncharacterized protein n=1 Tax=Catharanthus roseus TaxID=4058 RepID=A0ACC0AT40_CATRO|nr:hypothetical protein M9H77_22475 [Catharanthus roseus]
MDGIAKSHYNDTVMQCRFIAEDPGQLSMQPFFQGCTSCKRSHKAVFSSIKSLATYLRRSSSTASVSLACEDVLDMINRKDLEHFRKIFKIKPDFQHPKRRKRCKRRICGLSSKPSRAHLVKIIEYCKRLVTQPPFGDNNVEINCFVSKLVNNNEQTLFAADYLTLKRILSLACEEVLYFIKHKDSTHIPWTFNITAKFSAKDEERMRKKIVLQGSENITFEVDDAVAKQSVKIKHMIEDSLASRGLILLPKVPCYILAKVIEYCKHMAFVSTLVNDDVETLFELLVAADYLDINDLLSFACEDVLDMIKCKDPTHICRLFNITTKFFPEEEERMRTANLWAFN